MLALRRHSGTRAPNQFRRIGEYLQFNVGDLGGAVLWVAKSAMTKLRELEVPTPAQFNASSDQCAIDIQASSPLEFDGHAHCAGFAGTIPQYPTATAENCACQSLRQLVWIFTGERSHLHDPWETHHRVDFIAWRAYPHGRLIGTGQLDIKDVRKSNVL